MANNVIKGLTVEIGGDTTKLGKALQGVENQSRNLSTELGQVNRLLKLDPGNTELVAQKQKILAEAIKACAEKLETLREAEKQVQAQFERGEVSEEQVRALRREIIDTENRMQSYTRATKESEKESSKWAETLKGAVVAGLKAVAAAAAAAAAAGIAGAVVLGKSVVESYAEYEQLVGGVDTLFKESSKQVQEYAANAYKTAGLSSNEYMETVTGFSASLIQSLGGDTVKAAEYADMAITDMSDNANKMGTDMASIQNAYQGFAKQNYTMLDNLKLGYGGTKQEMERLLEDAEKIAGVKFNIDSYSDVVQSIHVMQESMGITGTTALEAEKTISGSINTTKAAWSNLIVGLGDSNANVVELCNQLVASIVNVINNITPVVSNVLASIPQAATAILDALTSLLPQLLQVSTNLVNQVITTLVNLVPQIIPVLLTAAENIVQTLVQIIPKLISGLLGLLPTLVRSLGSMATTITNALEDMLPDIVVAIAEVVPLLIDALIAQLPALLNASIKLLMAIVQAIPTIIQALIPQIPTIVQTVINGLINSIPQLTQGAIQLFMAIIQAIPTILVELGKALPQIITTIVDGLISGIGKIGESALQIGSAIVSGIWKGISGAAEWLWNKINGWIGGIWDGILDFLGIHSPSRKFAYVGQMLDEGLAKGLLDNASTPIDATQEVAAGTLGAAQDSLSGLSLERNLQWTGANRASSEVAASSTALGSKLDRILSAIEKGQIIELDGQALVGGTAALFDNSLGQRRVLVARGAL